MKAKSKTAPDPLYWNEFQLASALNMSADTLRKKRPNLERMGFPKRDGVICDQTYAPAVKSWLDRRAGLVAPSEEDEWMNVAKYGKR